MQWGVSLHHLCHIHIFTGAIVSVNPSCMKPFWDRAQQHTDVTDRAVSLQSVFYLYWKTTNDRLIVDLNRQTLTVWVDEHDLEQTPASTENGGWGKGHGRTEEDIFSILVLFLQWSDPRRWWRVCDDTCRVFLETLLCCWQLIRLFLLQ